MLEVQLVERRGWSPSAGVTLDYASCCRYIETAGGFCGYLLLPLFINSLSIASSPAFIKTLQLFLLLPIFTLIHFFTLYCLPSNVPSPISYTLLSVFSFTLAFICRFIFKRTHTQTSIPNYSPFLWVVLYFCCYALVPCFSFIPAGVCLLTRACVCLLVRVSSVCLLYLERGLGS